MKLFKLSAAAAALAFSTVAFQAAPALAQEAVEITTGATITGNDSVTIGTVLDTDGTNVVVDTGTYQIALPADAFASGDTGLTLNITKAELEASYAEILAQQQAALAAALVVGAPVMTADAQPLGTIETIEEENIILISGEDQMALPKNLFALDPNGTVMVLANLADIQAALAAAQAG